MTEQGVPRPPAWIGKAATAIYDELAPGLLAAGRLDGGGAQHLATFAKFVAAARMHGDEIGLTTKVPQAGRTAQWPPMVERRGIKGG